VFPFGARIRPQHAQRFSRLKALRASEKTRFTPARPLVLGETAAFGWCRGWLPYIVGPQHPAPRGQCIAAALSSTGFWIRGGEGGKGLGVGAARPMEDAG